MDGRADVDTRALEGHGERSEPHASFVIQVTSGPNAGQRLAIDADAPPLSVGSGPSSALTLSDPHVSRRHLALEVRGRGLRVQDLGSRNGTFLGSVRVVEVLLSGGETLRVGETLLTVHRGPDADLAPSPVMRFGRVLGQSAAMRKLYPTCEKLARSTVSVVLEGETGTGKEQLAEALHEEGARKDDPFVVFDCSAVAPNLIESALFGHERGAFTGAVAPRRGAFEQAHGGTLLLDEIGELDLALQPKLLRALQRGQIQRIGSDRWIQVDVRVLAATRRDLDREVQEGRFRDDLFYRLAVARIAMPPLRDRAGDVPLLARQFWKKLAEPKVPFPEEVLPRLEAYAWPGNVRELHNAIARIAALGEWGGLGSAAPAPAEEAGPTVDRIERIVDLGLPFPRARDMVTAEFEKLYIEKLLAKHHGNVSKAAQAAGIARRYFHVIKARQGG